MDDCHLGGERHSRGSGQLTASFLVAAVTMGIGPCRPSMGDGPFRLLTASLPTAFASGFVYAVLTSCFVVPSGRGGYRT
jgi:hypothetical protein